MILSETYKEDTTMDAFENSDYEYIPEVPEEAPPQEPQEHSYHAAGTGRKESPYANSPYEAYHAPREEYRYHPQTEPPVKTKKAKKPRKSAGKKILAAILALVLVAGSCMATSAIMSRRFNNMMEDMVQSHAEEMGKLQDQINGMNTNRGGITVPTDGIAMTPAQLYASQVNSVVAISTTIQSGYGSGHSSGSGFILTEDGYVLTNYHVVEGSNSITVSCYDGTAYEATLIGYDQSNDIAVLKVDATGLAPVVLGDSDQLNVGDPVVAIGNPLGELTFSLTSGAISAKDRQITMQSGSTMNLIQTDCAINSGNSGGALFSLYGEVVGITNAKYSSSSRGEASIDNIGFAIPMNDVKSIIFSIIEKGYFSKPYLGVSVTDVSPETQAYGLPQGAAIRTIADDSPAQAAGLQVNDIVTAADDTQIKNSNQLIRFVGNCTAGQTVTFTVYRAGQSINVTVTIGEQVQQAIPNNP